MFQMLTSRLMSAIGASLLEAMMPKAQSGHAETLRNTFHDNRVGIGFENAVGEQTAGLPVGAEIHKTFVEQQGDASLATPFGEQQHIGGRNKVATGVIGVDEQQGADGFVGKEVLQIGHGVT